MSRTRRKGYDWDQDRYVADRRDGAGKPCGFEYWAKRARGLFNGSLAGGDTKRRTNRYERRQYKQESSEE